MRRRQFSVFAGCALVLAAVAATAGAATPTATLVYRGLDSDQVGMGYVAGPDGKLDGHFTLTLGVDAPRVVSQISLIAPGGGVWDTTPQGSYTVLAVFRGGKRLNPHDEAIRDPVSGTVVYELYGGDFGYFGQPKTLSVVVTFTDGSNARVSVSAVVPATPKPGATPATPKPGATPPAPGAAAGPDTAKRVPDFWVSLSARVITRNTLGLGRDLALTTSSVNNQVLSVTVLERATGCMIEGANVELRDPQGALVPGTHMRTRAGLIDIGGLRLQKPGLYHVWVYAQDSTGKIVMQGLLPIDVKDRRGQAFETLNGRPFSYQGGQWVEGTRKTAAASSSRATQAVGSSPFAAFVSAFQQLLNGIASSTQAFLNLQQRSAARTASAILAKSTSTPVAAIRSVQAQTGLVASYLVTGPHEAAEARAADVSRTQVKLIGNDGASLITNDGGSLITNDGGSLITNDGGSLIAAGGNIISTSGSGLRHSRTVAVASAGTGVSPCLRGFKSIGSGNVVVIDGSPVLAGDDGKVTPGTIVLGGRNAMPVNGLAK